MPVNPRSAPPGPESVSLTEKDSPYAPLSRNVEAAINSLIVFVQDDWPENYRQGALRKSSPRSISAKRLKALGGKPPYSTVKKRPRKPSETLRIYGPPARRKWMKTLPCSACGVIGYSEGAHVLGNGGMSRKADADTQAPLCGGPYSPRCHMLYDEFRSTFDLRFPDFDPARAAEETEQAWQKHLNGASE